MDDRRFDFTGILARNLPPPALRFGGFPPFNFVGGHNDPASIPVAGLTEALNAVFAREGRTLATYGLQSGPLGYRPLREFLAAKLARQAGMKAGADDILITSGSLQAMDLVNALFLERGDTVIVEQETYGGALTKLTRLGVGYVGIPLDEDGMRDDALAAELRRLKASGIRPKYIYLIPTVQNPTGTVMSRPRRERILALSREYGVPIHEDECYADLVWSGERPPSFHALADGDGVVHIGSFSKSIAPALRLGYVVADWSLLSHIVALKSDGGSGALEQMLLGEFCNAHFDSHVPRLTAALRAKLDVLMEALAANFGAAAEFSQPAGGIFLWVKLPDTVDTTALFAAAAKEGVALNPGAEWSTDPAHGRSRLRLCFALPDAGVIRAGVERLARICQREFGVPERIANIDAKNAR